MDGGEGRAAGLAPGIGASNFEFALNSVAFSDRVLRLEIVPEDPAARFMEDASGGSPRSIFAAGLGGLGGRGTAAESAPPRKRRREDDTESVPQSSEFEVESVDGDALSVIGEDGEATVTPCVMVKHIHVSSLLLASKSPYFYKLFSNGMQESKLKEITLRITDYEHEALPELLSFIYSGAFKTSDPVLLLKVMRVADKFEVIHCMSYCSQLLISLPMTKELALLYLDYDCPVSISNALQPVKAAARDYLAGKYRKLYMSQAEVLDMPLSGIEAIFSSNNLEVSSEDFVLDFLLKWAYAKYPEAIERNQILIKSLLPLVRFNQLSCRRLLSFLSCQYLDHPQSSRLVISALLYKYNSAHRAVDAVSDIHCRYLERTYKFKPVKIIEFERPRKQCIAYMDLKYEECNSLFLSGPIRSQSFHFAGHLFFLAVTCNHNAQLGTHNFGLYLGVEKEVSVPITIEYEFAARTRPAGNFMIRFNQVKTFTSESNLPAGSPNMFNMSWDQLVAEASPFLIDNMLHLRAQLTVSQL